MKTTITRIIRSHRTQQLVPRQTSHSQPSVVADSPAATTSVVDTRLPSSYANISHGGSLQRGTTKILPKDIVASNSSRLAVTGYSATNNRNTSRFFSSEPVFDIISRPQYHTDLSTLFYSVTPNRQIINYNLQNHYRTLLSQDPLLRLHPYLSVTPSKHIMFGRNDGLNAPVICQEGFLRLGRAAYANERRFMAYTTIPSLARCLHGPFYNNLDYIAMIKINRPFPPNQASFGLGEGLQCSEDDDIVPFVTQRGERGVVLASSLRKLDGNMDYVVMGDPRYGTRIELAVNLHLVQTLIAYKKCFDFYHTYKLNPFEFNTIGEKEFVKTYKHTQDILTAGKLDRLSELRELTGGDFRTLIDDGISRTEEILSADNTISLQR